MDGQLLATQAAIRALIERHPQPNDAALAVQREIERVISGALQKQVSDAFVDGLQTAKLSLLPAGPRSPTSRRQRQ